MKIAFNDLKRGFDAYKNEYEEKALEVLNSGWYILGNEVKTFEEAFAKKNNIGYSIGVDNGLNAISLGLKCLNIGSGDEVIVQANTYIATVLGVTHNNAIPVFVEPDDYYNIDVKKIEEKISKKTKAILITHLYGQAAQMDEIVAICDKHKLFLLEDCAQAHFAKYNGKNVGTFGELGFFSFYPTKNLGAFGDGGAIITNHLELNEKLKAFRNYGSNKKYHNEVTGYNSRLDEMQAGFLNVKLGHIEELIDHRMQISEMYLKGITNPKLVLPKVREGATHTWHLFVVRVERREEFRQYLENNGIGTDVHYPIPPHLSKAYQNLELKRGTFPITENYADTVVSLPLFDRMRYEEVAKVIHAINKWK